MIEKVVQKLSQNSCSNIISLITFSNLLSLAFSFLFIKIKKKLIGVFLSEDFQHKKNTKLLHFGASMLHIHKS